MNIKDYDYEIERLLAQYGDDADHWMCRHVENAEDGSVYDETESGCWYHRTHAEQERLAAFVKKHCEEADRLRLEEQRRNGSGDCAGCPFRDNSKEMYWMLHELATCGCIANGIYVNRINELLRKTRGEK